MIAELIKKNRSCRRFHQNHTVDLETLKELVDFARLSASAANLQPLKYVLSCAPEKNALIFPCLGWAGYLKNKTILHKLILKRLQYENKCYLLTQLTNIPN